MINIDNILEFWMDKILPIRWWSFDEWIALATYIGILGRGSAYFKFNFYTFSLRLVTTNLFFFLFGSWLTLADLSMKYCTTEYTVL